MKTQVNCTEAEFHEHVENYDGLCMACGQWTEGGVEPDAQGYDCPSCDVPAVIGAEQALLSLDSQTQALSLVITDEGVPA